MRAVGIYLLGGAAIFSVGCFFAANDPLGNGFFVEMDFWSELFRLWSLGYVFFQVGAAHQKKKNERSKDEEH